MLTLPKAGFYLSFSTTETRTCEYEVQVLTAALCKSPLYSQKIDTDTFGIPCEKMGDKTPTGKFTSFFSYLSISAVPMGYKVAQSASQNAMSITTIDTKTGEVKQITQDELVDLLKEAAENPKESDPMPISVEKLQKILESVPQGDQDPLTIQGMGYTIFEHAIFPIILNRPKFCQTPLGPV